MNNPLLKWVFIAIVIVLALIYLPILLPLEYPAWLFIRVIVALAVVAWFLFYRKTPL